MADKTTFIKLDRNIINWRWFKNSKVLSVFIWLLLKANIKDCWFQKEKICRGSLVASNAHIADDCGLTMQNVRTALSDLESTGEIVRKQGNHYQIITIINYDLYQSGMRNLVGQLTSNLDGNSQATNKQLTTIKEYKNIKNDKNKRIPPKSPTGGQTPSEIPERGTEAFRNRSHLLLKPDEGTVDDIPPVYRELCNSDFETYWRYRNQ